jgi:hypothetical protein
VEKGAKIVRGKKSIDISMKFGIVVAYYHYEQALVQLLQIASRMLGTEKIM